MERRGMGSGEHQGTSADKDFQCQTSACPEFNMLFMFKPLHLQQKITANKSYIIKG